jgi:toxin ParE1/3/4
VRRGGSIDIRPRARRDLDEAADYLARENRELGRRFYAAARHSFRQLASMPRMGPPDFDNPAMAGVRLWRVRGFDSYLIVYRPTDIGVEVIRVLHAARDIEAILESS